MCLEGGGSFGCDGGGFLCKSPIATWVKRHAECRFRFASFCASRWGVILEKLLLTVEVRANEIIVRTLGFYATYFKSPEQPQLVLQERTNTDDYELLADAWRAANGKARELGWIV